MMPLAKGMQMRTSLARQIIADGRLEAELARREELRWLAEDDSGLTALVGHLGRFLAELEAPMRAGEIECEDGQSFDDLVARLDELRDHLEIMSAREEDEAAEIEHRPHVVATGRSHLKSEPPLSLKQSRASSPGRRARADAVAPTVEADAGGWRLGTVIRFDQIRLEGIVSFVGIDGSEEMPIGATVFRKSGLVSLFGGDCLECLVEVRGEGRKEIVDLKRSVASRRANAIRENPYATLAEKPIRARYFG
jgi:hypothetical protein